MEIKLTPFSSEQTGNAERALRAVLGEDVFVMVVDGTIVLRRENKRQAVIVSPRLSGNQDGRHCVVEAYLSIEHKVGSNGTA